MVRKGWSYLRERRALREEIAALRGQVAALSVQVAQLGAHTTHHFHYPPPVPPQPPGVTIWPNHPSPPNICQSQVTVKRGAQP